MHLDWPGKAGTHFSIFWALPLLQDLTWAVDCQIWSKTQLRKSQKQFPFKDNPEHKESLKDLLGRIEGVAKVEGDEVRHDLFQLQTLLQPHNPFHQLTTYDVKRWDLNKLRR